ncbi:MAG TPA: energy-coupling factor ABC transporter permease [Methanomassiliicoccales archaeon]|nr:energy-coupling factor ABC transporter permease [Methanomassiliicoccales archaeon]
MHIPDGLMAPEIWTAGWVLVLPVLAWAISRVNKNIDERAVPLMAIIAAGIFVAQMINFPIGGGTSGHLIGATIAVVLLGLSGAMVAMTVILIIQALMFGDGGLTALGLNLINMAVVAPLVAYLVLRVAGRKKSWSIMTAAWASTVAAAAVCSLQLSVSSSLHPGLYGIPGSVSFPAMLISNAIIGLGEAMITAGVVMYLAKVAPSMLRGISKGSESGDPGRTPAASLRSANRWAVIAILVAFVAGLIVFYAFSSGLPDSLQRLMQNQGISETGTNAPLSYGSDFVTSLAAGLMSFALVYAVCYLYLKFVTQRRSARSEWK